MFYNIIGIGIAAFRSFLAIERLNKPIYRFRLGCLGIRLEYLFAVVVVGFAMAGFAALLSNLPVDRDQIWANPKVWEFCAVFLIAGTCVLAGFCMFIPARLTKINYGIFVYGTANFLSEAKDEDLVAFAQDIAANILKVFQFTRALERAAWHEREMEKERLKEAGKPPSHPAHPPISAFYRFAKRKELNRGHAAINLLQLLADKKFCHVLVRDCPWVTARILNAISGEWAFSEGARNFVQEIARQAVTRPDSVLTHESEYDGLGSAPVLSNALFNNRFILKEYRPFRRLFYPLSISEDFIRKINHASKMALKLSLDSKDFSDSWDFRDIQSIYKGILHKLRWRHPENDDRTYMKAEWHHGITDICNETNQTLSRLEPSHRKLLFKKKDEDRLSGDLISIIAEIVCDSLEGVSKGFRGYDDKYWFYVNRVYEDFFEGLGRERDGLTPLQQKLLLRIVDKVRHNMEGGDLPILRVLLAVILPFCQKISENEKSSENIVQHLVYAELRNLSKLHKSSPEKVSRLVPDNVTYDGENNSLSHKYSEREVITYLDEIEIVEFDLFDESIWDLSPAEQPNGVSI